MTGSQVAYEVAGKRERVWSSAEIQRVDLRGHSEHELVDDLDRAARRAIATGCRRLVIELSDHDEPASLVVGALDAIGELMRSSAGELTIVRRSRRPVAPSANVQPQIKPAPPGRPDAAEPTKWAA